MKPRQEPQLTPNSSERHEPAAANDSAAPQHHRARVSRIAHSFVQPWVICDSELNLVEASVNWLFAYGLGELPTGSSLADLLPRSHVEAMLAHVAGNPSDASLLPPLDNELHDLRFLLSSQRIDSQQTLSDPTTVDGFKNGDYLFILREVSVGLAFAESVREKSEHDALLRALLHDLQSPLSAAHSALDLLCDLPLDDTTQETMELARASLERAQQYVRDFREFTLLETHRNDPKRSPVDLESFLDSMIDVYRLQGLPHPFTLSAPNDLYVNIEVHSFTRLLDNLIGNAIKYSPDGGEVRITAALKNSGEVEIRVEDQGVGIRPESLKKIFEPFYRSGQASAGQHSVEGTGLGLAVVKHVAKIHGAEVTASSTLGKGSCFAVILPQSLVADPPASNLENA